MGKANMIGQFKPYVPNSRADMRRPKQHLRNREYIYQHEEVMAAKREKRQLREMEETKKNAYR